ncbi:DUF309 domain-containing protein [Salibacterium sp. K-3]
MYLDAYIQFLVQFHASRDYFECHEILEDYWKEHDPGNRSSVWVGLIQTAVGLYHHRRSNRRGAEKIWKSARSILAENTKQLHELALDAHTLQQQLDEAVLNVQHDGPFHDINLPLTDPALIQHCKQECRRLSLEWQQSSDTSNHQLVHRHILRHRTQDPAERLRRKRGK